MNHCLVCGAVNEDEALQCVVCSAELSSTYSSPAHPNVLPSFKTSKSLNGSRSPFASQDAAFSFAHVDPQLLQAEQHLKSLTLNPYTATASKLPSDDGLLGPEDILLSVAPIAFDADQPGREERQTWVGAPHLPKKTSNEQQRVEESYASQVSLEVIPLEEIPNTQNLENLSSDLMINSSEVMIDDSPFEKQIYSSEMLDHQEFPNTMVGYAQDEIEAQLKHLVQSTQEEGQRQSPVANQQAIKQELSNVLSPATFIGTPQASTPHKASQHLEEDPVHHHEMLNESPHSVSHSTQQINSLNTQISQVQELPALSLEEIQNLQHSFDESNLTSRQQTKQALQTSLAPVTLRSSASLINTPPVSPTTNQQISLTPSSVSYSPAPSTIVIQQTQSFNPWPKRIFILFLCATILFLGSHIFQTDFKSSISPVIDYQIKRVLKVGSSYEVKIHLNSQDTVSLELPEGWLKNSQTPHVSFQGEKDITLQLPTSSLKLGINTLSLNSKDKDQAMIPLQLKIPVIYQLENLSPLNDKREYETIINIAKDWRLVESNATFKKIEHLKQDQKQNHTQYQLAVPYQARTEEGKVQIHLTFENESGDRQGYLEERSSKLAQLTCTLFTPVRNVRRPENRFRVSGKTAPKAVIKIEDQRIYSDQQGYFEGIIQVTKQGSHTFKMEIEAAGYQSYSRSLTLKREAAKNWWRSYKKAKKRGKKLRKSYPKRPYRVLKKNKGKKFQNKRVRMNGKVAWIHRNESKKWQYILMFACQPAACPTWIKVDHANWIDIGSRIQVFGVYEGYYSFDTLSGQSLSAPGIRARLITP